MNIKTIVALILIIVTLATASIAAYTGLGLPTQNDPLSIRQLSAQNEREMMGGGPGYGK